MSFWGWQGDHLCLPMSPDPCGRAQQSPKSAVGEAQSKGQDRALSQHPPRSASSQTSPRRAGQLRRDHASPARSLLLPPGKSSCSPPLSALPNPGLGAEPRSPLAWWRCRDPAAEPGCAGSHRGSDRLLSLQITPGFLFAFPHASLEHRWSIPPSSAAAALATTAPASPPAAAPPKISPQSKCWRGLWCPHRGRRELGPRQSGCPQGVGSQQYPTPAPALGLCRLLGNGSFLELAGNWEEEGKEPSGTTSRQCHQRGWSPVLEPPQGMPTWLLHPDEATLPGVGFGHRGHRTQPSCSQGSWATSRVGVPPPHQPPAPILALRV